MTPPVVAGHAELRRVAGGREASVCSRQQVVRGRSGQADRRVVRAEGLEPSACGLRVRCSTIELCPQAGNVVSVFSESGATRTPDLRVRSPALYPSELRTQCGGCK